MRRVHIHNLYMRERFTQKLESYRVYDESLNIEPHTKQRDSGVPLVIRINTCKGVSGDDDMIENSDTKDLPRLDQLSSDLNIFVTRF